MKWLLDLFGGKAVEETGKIIDNLTTSDSEKAAAKNEISKIVMDALGNLVNAQKDVLVTELSGSKLQRNWRPLVMLSFAVIVIFHYFVYPVLRTFNQSLVELPMLDTRFWDLLEIGLGGYVIGRSVEKVAESVTRNVDVSFLRKRDRKAALKDDDKGNVVG